MPHITVQYSTLEGKSGSGAFFFLSSRVTKIGMSPF